MKNEHQPAFGFVDNRSTDYSDNEVHYGLTKREYFVAMAMKSFIVNKGVTTFDATRNTEDVCGDIAQASCSMADTILKYLE